MRERMSASCLALISLVSAEAKCASGIVDTSRWGLMYSAARGTAMWVCASMVMLFGRASCPGLPWVRAAVSAYLFQIAIRWSLSVFFVVKTRPGADANRRCLDLILPV